MNRRKKVRRKRQRETTAHLLIASQKIVVYDLSVERVFQSLLLSRSQFGIENDRLAFIQIFHPLRFGLPVEPVVDVLDQLLRLLDFSRAYVGLGIDFLQPLRDLPAQFQSRGLDELPHFDHGFLQREIVVVSCRRFVPPPR